MAEQGAADLSLIVPRLLPLLSPGDEWVQETAANTLGAIGDRRAVEPLCALLSFSPRRLPKHPGPKTNHTVLAHAMVAHDEDNVRHAAAVALGEIRSPQGLSALRASASNENETKRNGTEKRRAQRLPASRKPYYRAPRQERGKAGTVTTKVQCLKALASHFTLRFNV